MTGPSDQAPAPRRKFLRIAAAGAASTGALLLAPGIALMASARAQSSTGETNTAPLFASSSAPDAASSAVTPSVSGPASGSVRWSLLIDAAKCSADCSDCVTACNAENGLSPARSPTDAQWIRKVQLKSRSSAFTASLPLMCQHCSSAPCVDVCPTGASFKRADGLVLVDRHRCIGCRYCMMACPYKARSFVHEPLTDQRAGVPRGKGCVEGCTMCVQRIDAHLQPACVQACQDGGHDAMLFGDLRDESSAISHKARSLANGQLRADLQLDPGVRYAGV